MTKITSASFSAQSSVAVDSCFSSTYTRYLINYTITTVSSAGIDLQFQWRYAGPTTQTSDYYGIVVPTQRGASSTNTVSENAAQLTLCNNLQASPEYTAGMINVDRVGNSSDNPLLWGNGFWGYYTGFMNYGGYQNVARTYTGFLLKTDSGTMTGTYSVYGVSN
ncbi:hypothetical protein EB001_27880 [bacterium]|nr:hypothetical protein [bacterium]